MYNPHFVFGRSRVTIPGEQLDNVQKIKWDPVGHNMAFVKNFNIYVTVDISDMEYSYDFI